MLNQSTKNNITSENIDDLQGIAKALIVGFSWSYAEIYDRQKRQELINKNPVQSPSQKPSNPS